MIDALAYFIAAVRAVAPQREDQVAIRSGEELLDRITTGSALATILDALSEAEREDLRLVLDGMLRASDCDHTMTFS